MTDWKEDAIIEHNRLKKEIQKLLNDRAKNENLVRLHAQKAELEKEIRMWELPYEQQLDDFGSQNQIWREKLIKEWDIEDKTFKCDAGSATIRTTKSLKIKDKKGLINLLQKIDKLAETIKTWDLTYLRKLADVKLIEEDIVEYEEKQNVVISEEKK